MIFGTCKLHTTRSGATQVLSKFCHNKHLTCEMAPHKINTTDAYNSYRQQCYFYLKTVVIHKKNIKLIIHSKANRYQQNYKQTILP